MNKPNEKLQAIFEAALALPSESMRADYLKRACPDAEFQREVESLLEAHRNPDSLFNEETVATRGPLSEGPGTVIGRYKLLQKIGEGGMGVIYMAEQTEPVIRKVALKIIKLGMDTKSVIARFEAERQALAMMDHPNIAKVLDAGTTDTGRPYFVMELVKGVPINQYCDKNHLPTKERLQLFMAVCQAIHHAHQKGVIHRDVKPSNILVTLHDGRPVPKVIDFGIAKATNQKLTEKTLFTHFAQMIGTPAYMSPEQAEMSGLDVDTRTDVYSLGVLLYELLTGTTPFPEKELLSKGYGEMQRIIAEQEPERPSLRVSTLVGEEQSIVSTNRSTELLSLKRQIKGDLDWIVMKALEKDRTHRYDTPNNLAADIERHLSDEPVLAAQPTVLYQLGKLYRRHKVGMAAAACFVLLLAVSACVSAAQAIKNKSLFTAAEEARLKAMDAQQRETELRRIAETERGNAEAERDRGQRLLYTAHMNLAKRAWDEANVGQAIELLERHRPGSGRPDLRHFEWFYLDRISHSELLTLKGHTDEVWGVAFSPDGKRLASASGDYRSPQKQGEVKVWDATTGQGTMTLKGHTAGRTSVAFSPDEKLLASGSGDNTVKVWDATTGQELLTLKGHTNEVLSIAFSPDGKRLASASNDETVRVWDTTSGQELLTLKGHTFLVWGVAFSPDGQRLASASLDRTVRVWDAASGQETFTLKGHTDGVRSVAFSPDGKRLVSASNNGVVKVWNPADGRELLSFEAHVLPITCIAVSPDGKHLATASVDQTVRLWDAANGQELRTLKGHTGPAWGVSFSPDGTRLATASNDQTVKVWDITRHPEVLSLNGHTNWLTSVVFSPDGKRLASASYDKTVKVWDTARGQELLTLNANPGGTIAAFSPDGKRLAAGSSRGMTKIWDAETGRELATLKGHTNDVYLVEFSPDGKRLASVSEDRAVKVWDAASGQELLTLGGQKHMVRSLAFSPDGRRLALGTSHPTIKVWDATSGQELLALEGHSGAVVSVAFSADGKWLASGGFDSAAKLWDAATGQEILTFRGHHNGIMSVAFSPDGKRLATLAWDGVVKVWDSSNGDEMLTLKPNFGPTRGDGFMMDASRSVAFSPDGTRLASAHYDLTVRIWDARPRSETSTR